MRIIVDSIIILVIALVIFMIASPVAFADARTMDTSHSIAIIAGSRIMDKHIGVDVIDAPVGCPKAQITLMRDSGLLKITEYSSCIANMGVVKNAFPPKMNGGRKTHFAGKTQFINEDKTYEQCMNEAFERIYEEVNKMLDRLAEQRNE